MDLDHKNDNVICDIHCYFLNGNWTPKCHNVECFLIQTNFEGLRMGPRSYDSSLN